VSKRKIFLFGALTISIIAVIMAVLFPLQGSRSSDIQSNADLHSDISPCPDSPNCITVSQTFSSDSETLLEIAKLTLEKFSPFEINEHHSDKRIDSVFRIPVFRFKDDLILISEPHGEESILHIKSSSRVGYSDLGVNRRRVKKIIRELNKNLP